MVQRSSTSACHAEDRGFESHWTRLRLAEARLRRGKPAFENPLLADFLISYCYMNIKFDEFFKKCDKNEPVSETVLKELNNRLPKSYFDFLKFSNGVEGEVSNGSYLQLWKAEELDELNKSYQANEFVPGMFLIGGDGGNEAIGIDLRKDGDSYQKFFRVPFISLEWQEAIELGSEVTDIKIV